MKWSLQWCYKCNKVIGHIETDAIISIRSICPLCSTEMTYNGRQLGD